MSKYVSYLTIKRCFSFLDVDFHNPDFRGSPRIRKRGTPGESETLTNIVCNNLDKTRAVATVEAEEAAASCFMQRQA